MRALLIVVVVLTGLAAIVGALGLTTYFAVRGGARALGHHRVDSAPVSRWVVGALSLYSTAMAVCAGALTLVIWRAPQPTHSVSTARNEVPAELWVALFIWACIVAAVTSVILWRRTRRHRLIEPTSINQRTEISTRNKR